MDKEDYKKLSKEDKWIVSKEYLEILKSASSNRMGLLPFVAGLSGTLLIIATFNEKFIPLDNTVRGIVSILLLLIPLSLYFYNEDLKVAASGAKNELDNLNGKPNIKETIKTTISKWMPDLGIYSLGIIALILIVKIWNICL